MATTNLPLEWLKEVPTALLHLDDIPLLGFPPVFPWTEFSEKLKEHLQAKTLKIDPLNLQWRNPEDLFSGLGSDLIPLHFMIPSLEGDLCMIVAKRDIELLMSLLITNSENPLNAVDQEFQNGFIQFLAYETIFCFNQCNFDKTLNPHLSEKKENSDEDLKEMLLGRENSLSQDISFSFNNSTFIFRLIISNEFRKSWKEKYASRTLEIPLNPIIAQKIHLPVALEAGRVSLTLQEWKELNLGDFLILDFCSLDPESDKSKIMLTVNGNHFFRARLKQGSLKILEHPLFYEGQINQEKTIDKSEAKEAMAKENPPNNEENFEMELDDFTFSDTLDEETPAPAENEEGGENESENKEDKEEHEEDQDLEPIAAHPKFNRDEIVLDVIVEVGRLEMSIQKLTELQPGNILEIDVRPENGVDLVVNGKRIGKGELLKLGEVLGVRILDI